MNSENNYKKSNSELSERQKLVILICAFYSSIILALMYFNLSAFLPLFVEENYKENISTKMVGALVSTMELAGIVSSPVHASTISKMGRKNAWLFGTFSVIIGTFLLGCMANIG
jgi:MFS family permease